MAFVKIGLFLFALALGCSAQPITVYSEFARIDASGKVTAPESPREILSPAIVRNGFTSFQIVVDVPKGTPWQLYVAQNPTNAVKVTLYREGERFEPLMEPVAGDGTQVFWMDLWRDKNTSVERIKVEPQLYLNEDWIIYPMEARVMGATVPDGKLPEGFGLAYGTFHEFLCGPPARRYFDYKGDLLALQYRNAQQDIALAARVPRAKLQELFGSCTAAAPANPESYFRIRDYLFQGLDRN